MSTEHAGWTERTDWSTWPAEIVWYQSPYDDDPSVLVEILAHDPRKQRGIDGPDIDPGLPAWQALGSVSCASVAAAMAEVPLLPLEHAVPIWRGVYAICLPDGFYPCEWHKIKHPIPGQEWPEDTVALGGCLECGATGDCRDCRATGVCSYCEGKMHRPCVCNYDGYHIGKCRICRGSRKCLICEGTELLPAPRHLVYAFWKREVAHEEVRRLQQAREEEEREIKQRHFEDNEAPEETHEW